VEFLSVKITRFVDDHQPGWVACEFEDARGVRHTIVEKVPVVTSKNLDASSVYPQPALIGCKILERLRDTGGNHLVRITLEWDVSSAEGISDFVVLPTQISEIHEKPRH
jgi:hypothetical protein